MYGFREDYKWPGLAKLNKEAGEVVQVIGKIMMINGETEHWSGDLRIELIEEMADNSAALAFVANECLTDAERLEYYKRRAQKLTRYYTWYKEGRKP